MFVIVHYSHINLAMRVDGGGALFWFLTFLFSCLEKYITVFPLRGRPRALVLRLESMFLPMSS